MTQTLRTSLARQRISQADYIGIVLQNSSAQAGFSSVPCANPTKLFEGPGAFDTTPFTTTFSSNGELLLHATVELDTNNNGCGDQTQEHLCAGAGGGGDGGGGGDDGGAGGDDGEGEDPGPPTPDPLAGLRAGRQPEGRLLGKVLKASKKGVFRLTISNPNAFRLTGKLKLKSKRLALGLKAFSIAAGSRKTLRLKLSGGAFRALKRRRKIAAMATATVRGPIGRSRTVKKRYSLKAPKRPKQRRSGSGGGGGAGGK